MKISFDTKYNIAYIRFRPKTKGLETIKISDELVIDLAPDGSIYGIKLLNANKQLQLKNGKLKLANERISEKVALQLID